MSEIRVIAPVSRRPAALQFLGDERLARRAAAGNEAAFAVIFERYHQGLYRYCRSMLDHDDASDALQNTMAAALRSLPGERREVSLKPWLYRVAHNEAVSLLRRRRPSSELSEDVASTPGPEEVSEVRQRLAALTADLRELPERQSGALVMRELNGLGYEEIAAAFGISEAAAKQSVYNARLALQQFHEGREMDCESVRASLSANDGRVLRALKLRSHLRHCDGCSAFKAIVGRRQSDLAMLAPPIAPVAAAALLESLLHGGGGSAGGGGLLALLSGGGGKIAAAGAAAKTATAVGAALVLGAGVATVEGVPGLAVGAEGDASGTPSSTAQHRADRPGNTASDMSGQPGGILQRTSARTERAGGKQAPATRTNGGGPAKTTAGGQPRLEPGRPPGRGVGPAAPSAPGREQARGHVPSGLPAPAQNALGGDGQGPAPGSQAPTPHAPPVVPTLPVVPVRPEGAQGLRGSHP